MNKLKKIAKNEQKKLKRTKKQEETKMLASDESLDSSDTGIKEISKEDSAFYCYFL